MTPPLNRSVASCSLYAIRVQQDFFRQNQRLNHSTMETQKTKQEDAFLSLAVIHRWAAATGITEETPWYRLKRVKDGIHSIDSTVSQLLCVFPLPPGLKTAILSSRSVSNKTTGCTRHFRNTEIISSGSNWDPYDCFLLRTIAWLLAVAVFATAAPSVKPQHLEGKKLFNSILIYFLSTHIVPSLIWQNWYKAHNWSVQVKWFGGSCPKFIVNLNIK